MAGGELQVDSGLLVRRARRVPLARVQSVDVVRPLVGRLLGLAELRLEVVGGGDTEAPLSYLAEQDARALRAVLLSEGRAHEDGAQDPAEQVLVRVPTGVLLASVLLGAPVVLLAVAVPVLVVVLVVEPRAALPLLATAGPALFGVGGLVVRRVLAEYGSTVAESPEGLRLRHGLLETRTADGPAGPRADGPGARAAAVAAVRLGPGRGRRRRLRGAGRGAVGDVRAAAGRPAAARRRARRPRAGRRAAGRRRTACRGGPAGGPRCPRAASPSGWTTCHLVTTRGVLTTTTDVVPLAKVQSLRTVQGPWQRRLRLTTVVADTAGRRLPGGVAPHRDDGRGAGAAGRC